MPYRRRTFKKAGYKRPKFNRYRRSTMKPRTWKKRIFRRRKGPRAEYKQAIGEAYGNIGTVDAPPADQPTTTQAPVTAIVINQVAQGAGSTQRIGRLITNKSILLQGVMENLDTDNTVTAKIYLILDKSPNAVTYSGTTPIEENRNRYLAYRDIIWAPQSSETSDISTKMRNPLYKERFKILKVKNISLGAAPKMVEVQPPTDPKTYEIKFQGTYPNKRSWKLFQKLKSKTTYIGATSLPIQKNQLMLFVETDHAWVNPDVHGAGVKSTWNSQFSYTDA